MESVITSPRAFEHAEKLRIAAQDNTENFTNPNTSDTWYGMSAPSRHRGEKSDSQQVCKRLWIVCESIDITYTLFFGGFPLMHVACCLISLTFLRSFSFVSFVSSFFLFYHLLDSRILLLLLRLVLFTIFGDFRCFVIFGLYFGRPTKKPVNSR